MVSVADRAMRELCRYYGAAFTVGELAKPRGIVLNDKSVALLTASDMERPFGFAAFRQQPRNNGGGAGGLPCAFDPDLG